MGSFGENQPLLLVDANEEEEEVVSTQPMPRPSTSAERLPLPQNSSIYTGSAYSSPLNPLRRNGETDSCKHSTIFSAGNLNY
jgi:hypothetical protein